MQRRYLLIATAVFACLAAVFGGLYWHTRSLYQSPQQYPLLAHRIFQQNPDDTIINFAPLSEQIKSYFASIGIAHSFYFEYLFTGTSIRDGDSNKLVGASLMKIPIVLDLYKAAEEGKISLDQRVTVPNDASNGDDPTYGNQAHLKVGDQISLRDAAKITLQESDNTAAYAIFNATKDLLPDQDQSLNSLDVETQTGDSSKGSLVYISARAYTSILKCLYFSCFLNFDDSQSILNLLSNGSDTSRIRAGVPSEIKVVRKIGSFSNITQSDCGIVYVPNRRYALCVMLDEDSAAADQHIKKLSEMVYGYIASLNN